MRNTQIANAIYEAFLEGMQMADAGLDDDAAWLCSQAKAEYDAVLTPDPGHALEAKRDRANSGKGNNV